MTKKLVVIGGGAAGFFCAVHAAENPGTEVILLEKTGKLLSKVKVSGGGRCNVTHHCFSIPEMVKNYPRGGNFLKKAFRQFFTTDTIKWFKQAGLELKTEADGRMFPVTDSSESVIRILLQKAASNGVKIQLNQAVHTLEKTGRQWLVLTERERILADAVCVTSGGFSKLSGYAFLENAGITILPPVPSLFTINAPADGIKQLMGVSVSDSMVSISGTKFSSRAPVLITHWGLSGPAVLKLSARAALHFHEKNYQEQILVNWAPEYNEHSLTVAFKEWRLALASQKLKNSNTLKLPERLWLYLLEKSGANPDMRRTDLPSKTENRLVKNICSYQLQMDGKTTFKEEFVTAGGVDTTLVDPDTMESRQQPGLFFAGEVLNVDGITGGFNFQNAWTTGYIAAKGIAAFFNSRYF